MENIEKLTEKEAEFCLMYVNGAAPYAGDPRRCYKAVFGETISDPIAQHEGLKLLKKECVKNRVEELKNVSGYSMESLKLKMTSQLIKIIDECSSAEVKDRFGKKLSSAPLRAVAVNAIKTVNDMYGIKEDIAHTVNLNSENGNGITFNINVPQPQKNNLEEEFND